MSNEIWKMIRSLPLAVLLLALVELYSQALIQLSQFMQLKSVEKVRGHERVSAFYCERDFSNNPPLKVWQECTVHPGAANHEKMTVLLSREIKHGFDVAHNDQ